MITFDIIIHMMTWVNTNFSGLLLDVSKIGKYLVHSWPSIDNFFFFLGQRVLYHSSVQFSHSVVSDSLRPHGLQHPGLPVHHQLPEFTQTHVHWVGDAIQPSHPLLSPSPPALNLSQHQGLFKWASFSQQVAKLLEFQLQHQSFQRTPRTDLL